MERHRWPKTAGSSATVCRLIARVIGSMTAAMWIVIFVAGIVQHDQQSFTDESAILAVLTWWAILGVTIAFRHERAGSIVTLTAGCALAIFAALAAGRNIILAVLISSGPFLLSGALFAASWWLRREA